MFRVGADLCVRPLIHPIVHPLIHPIVHPLIHPIVHPLIHPIVRPLTSHHSPSFLYVSALNIHEALTEGRHIDLPLHHSYVSRN